jgi:hypothetical protein
MIRVGACGCHIIAVRSLVPLDLSNACQYKRLAAMNKLASCRKGRVLGMQEVQFSGLKINPSNRASWHLTQNKVWSTAKNGSLSSGSGLAQMVCYAKELGVLLNNVWSTAATATATAS